MNLSDKTIFITGADGFIGSHLTETLVGLGYNVRAFVYYNSFNSRGWLDHCFFEKNGRIEIISGDIRDSSHILRAMRGCNIVFHLAALIGIPYSYHAPDSYVQTNVMGTLNVLQSARENKVERILVTSTSEVYGTAQYVPIDEKHPLQGQSPYSATKIGADKLAESFYRSFDLPVSIVRPFNTYGPRQSARAIIPTIITQLLSGEKNIKLGSLHPIRDLVFVKDTVKGFIKIAESDKTIGKEVNICTQKSISMKDLAEKIISIINPDAKIVSDKKRIRPKKSEVDELLGSNKLIKKLTGWKQQYSLTQGLNETIEWFRNNMKGLTYKPGIYNV